MAKSRTQPWPHERHHSLIYENHPLFGYYVYCDTTGLWSQLRVTEDGREFMLRCQERTPSNERLKQWEEIDSRLTALEPRHSLAEHSKRIQASFAALRVSALSAFDCRILSAKISKHPRDISLR